MNTRITKGLKAIAKFDYDHADAKINAGDLVTVDRIVSGNDTCFRLSNTEVCIDMVEFYKYFRLYPNTLWIEKN